MPDASSCSTGISCQIANKRGPSQRNPANVSSVSQNEFSVAVHRSLGCLQVFAPADSAADDLAGLDAEDPPLNAVSSFWVDPCA